MPRTAARGGPETRARIREVANRLFLERGYDAVTVAEVARQAGVSSVTVFNHYKRKEDLFLDRTEDAFELLRAAVRDRADGVDVLTSLEMHSAALFADRSPLSGVAELSGPFYRTVAESPALVSRAREILSELQAFLAAELARDPLFDGDARLLATLVLAGYAAVMVETAQRVMAGSSIADVTADHGERLERLFTVLRSGF